MPPIDVIDVERLIVTYGDLGPVRDRSLDVQRGELHARLAIDGAGRTSHLDIGEGHCPAASRRARTLGQSQQERRTELPLAHDLDPMASA